VTERKNRIISTFNKFAPLYRDIDVLLLDVDKILGKKDSNLYSALMQVQRELEPIIQTHQNNCLATLNALGGTAETSHHLNKTTHNQSQ